MPKPNQLQHDKLKLAAKLLFELPPSDTLPVFKRLSIDNIKTLLDQIKEETPEGRGEYPRRINKFKKQESFHMSNGVADMKRLATLTDDEIKAILKHCDTSFWAPALKNAPVAIQQKIMNCMAPVAAKWLKTEIDEIGIVNEQEEKLAREGIIQATFRLATNGYITQQQTQEPEVAWSQS